MPNTFTVEIKWGGFSFRKDCCCLLQKIIKTKGFLGKIARGMVWKKSINFSINTGFFSRCSMVCFTKQPPIYLKTCTQLKLVQSTDAKPNISNTYDSKYSLCMDSKLFLKLNPFKQYILSKSSKIKLLWEGKKILTLNKCSLTLKSDHIKMPHYSKKYHIIHKNLEDYTTDLGKASKYLKQSSMTHLLGIKSNTDFPRKIELHNNHTENNGKITQQKVLSKT